MNQVMTQNKSGNGLEILGMKINSLTEAMQLADFFAKSELVPKDYKGKPGNIVVAWQKGYEVGLAPQQSLETIAVINGRACIWGDGLIALIKNNPKEEWTNEWMDGSGENAIAYCETKRAGQPKTIKGSFSVAQAKIAGLWGVNTWKKYPERMLQMRARGFCFRDAYPDVLNGLQLAEEQLDASVNIKYTTNIDEIEVAVRQLGLTLKKENNIAVVQGNTFTHSKVIKELGFEFVNNLWTLHYEDSVVNAQVITTTQNNAPKSSPVVTPAKELMQYLTNNGLTKEEVGSFVKDVLGLSSSDSEGIQALLADNNTLNLKIQEFLGAVDDNEIPEDLF
jgi:hypothetical protein